MIGKCIIFLVLTFITGFFVTFIENSCKKDETEKV